MKKNLEEQDQVLEDQDQVLEDQRRRRSTSPAETNTLAKLKTMALYHSLDSLAIQRVEQTCKKKPLQELLNIFLNQNTQIRILFVFFVVAMYYYYLLD